MTPIGLGLDGNVYSKTPATPYPATPSFIEQRNSVSIFWFFSVKITPPLSQSNGSSGRPTSRTYLETLQKEPTTIYVRHITISYYLCDEKREMWKSKEKPVYRFDGNLRRNIYHSVTLSPHPILYSPLYCIPKRLILEICGECFREYALVTELSTSLRNFLRFLNALECWISYLFSSGPASQWRNFPSTVLLDRLYPVNITGNTFVLYYFKISQFGTLKSQTMTSSIVIKTTEYMKSY